MHTLHTCKKKKNISHKAPTRPVITRPHQNEFISTVFLLRFNKAATASPYIQLPAKASVAISSSPTSEYSWLGLTITSVADSKHMPLFSLSDGACLMLILTLGTTLLCFFSTRSSTSWSRAAFRNSFNPSDFITTVPSPPLSCITKLSISLCSFTTRLIRWWRVDAAINAFIVHSTRVFRPVTNSASDSPSVLNGIRRRKNVDVIFVKRKYGN